MPEIMLFTPGEEAAGRRLDSWLARQEKLNLSRSAIQDLLEQGAVLRNGALANKKDHLQAGDCISVEIFEPLPLGAVPQNIPVEIVYEDSELLVVNKPKGMVVHPAPGHPDGTLVNALLYACSGKLSGINGVLRPGIVHRIDRDTSGLLVVAKTDFAHKKLAEQIATHSFLREYEAVVCGVFPEKDGTVHAPIGRDPRNRKRMTVTAQNSKDAITHYSVIQQFPRHAHIRCRLETGRTHQIRVHMRYIGHPVYGDAVYGKPEKNIEGQCLHARKLGFIHPLSGEEMVFDSPLPEYFETVLRSVRPPEMRNP